MYFVPLSQLESVELLVHSLKAAAGEADCKMCPAYKVCMKQCLTIADSVGQMLQNGTLPYIGGDAAGTHAPGPEPEHEPEPPGGGASGGSHLKIVK